jgi:hypothetical protein
LALPALSCTRYFADVQIVNIVSQTSQLDQCCDRSNVVGSSMHTPCEGEEEEPGVDAGEGLLSGSWFRFKAFETHSVTFLPFI